MLFRVDPASAVPLGDQIAACVRGALADGSANPGECLPAGRELADSLGANVHTVLRGYQRLREEGLIELRRGRGAVIVPDAPGPRPPRRARPRGRGGGPDAGPHGRRGPVAGPDEPRGVVTARA